jgi:hypothetical protein
MIFTIPMRLPSAANLRERCVVSRPDAHLLGYNAAGREACHRPSGPASLPIIGGPALPYPSSAWDAKERQ